MIIYRTKNYGVADVLERIIKRDLEKFGHSNID